MMTDCPFCKIIRGEAPAEILGGFDSFANIPGHLIIRPLGPVNDTHVLFLARQHIENFMELETITGYLMTEVAKYARRYHDLYEESNIITSAGPAATQTVPHFHIHLIGREPDDGLTLPWGKLSHEHKMKEQPGESQVPS